MTTECFKEDNGQAGTDYCRHTTTGYECVARHNGNMITKDCRVTFFIRHVVSAEGHPYIEVGLDGVDDYERALSLNLLKSVLTQKHYREVFSLSENWPEGKIFNEYKRPDRNSLILRVDAGKKALAKVAKYYHKLISPMALRFILDQEKLKDVLMQSILTSMGPELQKGPGGKSYAVCKARHLAKEFYDGFVEQPFILTAGRPQRSNVSRFE